MWTVEIRGPLDAAREAPSLNQPSAADRVGRIWPLLVVGLGLLATVAWTAVLGWLFYRAALMLLA